MVRRFFVSLPLILLSASAVAADLRGFVSEGGAGLLQLQFCKGETLSAALYPIDDKTPNGSLRSGVNAVRRIMLHPYRPLYVEVKGERGKTGVTAYQFQRAIGTVESCKALPRDVPSTIRLSATGESPFWRLTVSDTTAVLDLPEKVSLKLPAAAFKAAGTDQSAKKTISQTYELQVADGKPVAVEVNPQMCTDGRSETAYGARVVVQIERKLLQGCAGRF